MALVLLSFTEQHRGHLGGRLVKYLTPLITSVYLLIDLYTHVSRISYVTYPTRHVFVCV